MSCSVMSPYAKHVLCFCSFSGGLIGVNTCALEAIANPAWGAVAFEASSCVGAGSVSVAVMGSDLTLVYIWQKKKKLVIKTTDIFLMV